MSRNGRLEGWTSDSLAQNSSRSQHGPFGRVQQRAEVVDLSGCGDHLQDTVRERVVGLGVDAQRRQVAVRPAVAAQYPAQCVMLPTMPGGQSGAPRSPRRIGAGGRPRAARRHGRTLSRR